MTPASLAYAAAVTFLAGYTIGEVWWRAGRLVAMVLR